MRAIYLNQDIEVDSAVMISGDQAKHLVKVIRVKLNEEVLLLNGDGLRARATVKSMDKKELTLQISEVINESRKYIIDLALSLPKKDAVEEILKKMTEMGVRKFIPLKSKYSQIEWKLNDRFNKIVESALVQSNNCFFPKFEQTRLLSDLKSLEEEYDYIFFFSSVDGVGEAKDLKSTDRILIIIGPEAGFSTEEEEELASLSKSMVINFPSPILRAPTAVCVALGYLFGNIN